MGADNTTEDTFLSYKFNISLICSYSPMDAWNQNKTIMQLTTTYTRGFFIDLTHGVCNIVRYNLNSPHISILKRPTCLVHSPTWVKIVRIIITQIGIIEADCLFGFGRRT